MELDHSVVLFDEIDELVREREVDAVDAFGRFLTTSMLPKLAQLWENRKLMYFVATNHIIYFDRAITRSGRFDALIFVSPPSFSAKIAELLRLLQSTGRSVTVKITQAEVDESIDLAYQRIKKTEKGDREKLLDEEIAEDVLSKFALLRWDEIKWVATPLLPEAMSAVVIDRPALEKALKRIRRSYRELWEYCRDRDLEGPADVKYAPRRFE